mmetsp:Transcript_156152/g.500906  ORF Transcript_156152/g.500906 Transcript_156152/m.500906 type:complete len:213 (+) Transcript_156152:1355-1993(+)
MSLARLPGSRPQIKGSNSSRLKKPSPSLSKCQKKVATGSALRATAFLMRVITRPGCHFSASGPGQADPASFAVAATTPTSPGSRATAATIGGSAVSVGPWALALPAADLLRALDPSLQVGPTPLPIGTATACPATGAAAVDPAAAADPAVAAAAVGPAPLEGGPSFDCSRGLALSLSSSLRAEPPPVLLGVALPEFGAEWDGDFVPEGLASS